MCQQKLKLYLKNLTKMFITLLWTLEGLFCFVFNSVDAYRLVGVSASSFIPINHKQPLCSVGIVLTLWGMHVTDSRSLGSSPLEDGTMM